MIEEQVIDDIKPLPGFEDFDPEEVTMLTPQDLESPSEVLSRACGFYINEQELSEAKHAPIELIIKKVTIKFDELITHTFTNVPGNTEDERNKHVDELMKDPRARIPKNQVTNLSQYSFMDTPVDTSITRVVYNPGDVMEEQCNIIEVRDANNNAIGKFHLDFTFADDDGILDIEFFNNVGSVRCIAFSIPLAFKHSLIATGANVGTIYEDYSKNRVYFASPV